MEERKKPVAKLIGQDGNVFNLIGICSRALEKVGAYAEAKEMKDKIFMSSSYDEALAIMMDYCEVE